MDITQEEYRVTKQRGRIIHTKINILNFNFQTVGEISGVVLDGSTYSTDATSDIRRSCSISLIPKDSQSSGVASRYILRIAEATTCKFLSVNSEPISPRQPDVPKLTLAGLSETIAACLTSSTKALSANGSVSGA